MIKSGQKKEMNLRIIVFLYKNARCISRQKSHQARHQIAQWLRYERLAILQTRKQDEMGPKRLQQDETGSEADAGFP